MEWIEARALKSSFLSETTQQVFVDDVYGVNSINGVVSYDDFSVDVFLDLSNEDFKDVFVGEESEEEKETLSVSSSQDTSTTFSGAGDSGCLSAGELAVPVDDLEDLEWFSQLVDDSVSELSLLCPKVDNRFEPVSRPAVQRTPVLCFPTPVPVKARSKRSRPSGRVWSYDSTSLTESSSTTSSCGSSPISVLIFPNPVQGDGVVKPPAKKQRKRPKAEAGSETNGSTSQRRCSHCQVQKTPQWRTGPLGAKTLCNACGVRYKSGRLFPEYRPACSPTFSSDMHSNSHRKVLEMRQKKVVTGDESGLTSIV